MKALFQSWSTFSDRHAHSHAKKTTTHYRTQTSHSWSKTEKAVKAKYAKVLTVWFRSNSCLVKTNILKANTQKNIQAISLSTSRVDVWLFLCKYFLCYCAWREILSIYAVYIQYKCPSCSMHTVTSHLHFQKLAIRGIKSVFDYSVLWVSRSPLPASLSIRRWLYK